MSDTSSKPEFVPLKDAEVGTHWSNRYENGKHFKNYGDVQSIPKFTWERFTRTLHEMTHSHPKPHGGYKAFGKIWYAPCNMAESVAAWRRTPEAQQHDRVYFIGHATQLLCLANGINILFDPIFSKRASPVSFAGPARRYPAATTVDQLPPIHIVTVSHNHYDHMDKTSLKALRKRFPDARFVVPLKADRHLLKWGIPATSITTLDWYEECELHNVRIGSTPAQHWGKRSIADNNEALWCGWCIGWKRPGGDANANVAAAELAATTASAATATTTATGTKKTRSPISYSGSDLAPAVTQQSWNQYKKYFFTGDTAYNADVHTNIYAHFGPMDMASLPIGAYAPRSFLWREHVEPKEAVQIFKDQHIEKAMAVHWATFELSDELLDEPPKLLAEALTAAGIEQDRFQAIPMGKHIDF